MSEKVEIIAELKDLVSGKFKEINGQIDAMDKKLSNISSGSGKGGIMGQVVGANLLTSAINKAGSALSQFAKDSFDAYGKQEQFQVALTTLLYGNTNQAEALNNQLKQFALETPFELSEIQQSTRLMIAYGSTAGSVVDEMRMLGDVASGTAQPLNEVAYLYGTIRQQQKANLIDLRQFANRGIPIFKELAKVTKYSLAQLVEGGKDVDVTFRDVEKAFKNMTSSGSQFHNMMAQQSKTLLGQQSNLSDAWEQLQSNIGKSQEGILKGTVAWATNMVKSIGRVVEASNFKDETTGGLPAFIRDPQNDDRDNIFTAYSKAIGGDGKREVKKFKTLHERDRFLGAKNVAANAEGREAPWAPGDDRNTKWRAEAFQNDMFNRLKTTSATNAQERLNEAVSLRREILKERGDGSMSPALAANELAALAKNIRMFSEMVKTTDLEKSKTDSDAKPKELETLAKQNRATTINVHIENLVREYDVTVSTPKEAQEMSASSVSKALLSAVNDLYAVGQ